MDEKQRIRKILGGDTNAFGYFVDAYQDMAVTIAFRISRNKQDAEDIVQNAFVKAFHNLHAFRADSRFSTWFYRIVYNTAVNHISSSLFSVEFEGYDQVQTDGTFSEWDALSQMEAKERSAILNNGLEQLPTDESLLLTLYYLDDNSIKEIVLITGLSESNVKVKLHRARKRLAEIVSKCFRKETIF